MKARSGILVSAVLAALPLLATASSHREAPAIARAPAVDSTDFYMFMSYDPDPAKKDYVTIIANYNPLQDPYGGPNYFALDPFALYEIHIDNDGDAKEDITFEFQFDDDLGNKGKGIALDIGVGDAKKTIAVPLKNIGPVAAGVDNSQVLNFNESYALTVVRGDRRGSNRSDIVAAAGDQFTSVERDLFIDPFNNHTFFGSPFQYVGNKTFKSEADYEKYARQFIHSVNIPGCSFPANVFVGQRKESFAVNLGRVFDLVNFNSFGLPIVLNSIPSLPNVGIKDDKANNIIDDKNITEFAIEIHKSCLVGNGNGVIGGWTSASLRQGRAHNPLPIFKFPHVDGGNWTQVSRLGMPLVNEVVVGLPDKDRFSASEPKNDGQFLKYVTNPTLPALLNALFLKTVNGALGTTLTDIAPTAIPRNDLVTTFLTGFPGVNQLKLVTASEMTRLNTGIPATPKDKQSTFGVAGLDFAGFPNGRRPGDDVVDIELRVAMGALCHLKSTAFGTPDNKVPGIKCVESDAVLGNVQFSDGAPVNAGDFDAFFPYLRTPLRGSPQPGQN